MFKNAMQTGLLTIFSSKGSSPLRIWELVVQSGQISCVLDTDIAAQVVEILGLNVSTTYMICPKKPFKSLAIRLPFLIMIVKNLHQYFSFEITVLDDTDQRRRFRVSNFQSKTSVQSFCTAMPIALSDGWNQIQFNLLEFTKRAYQRTYTETVSVKINANTRLRRIYFADKLYDEKDLPPDYKLFIPIKHSSKKRYSKEQQPEPSKEDSKLALEKEPSVHAEEEAPPAGGGEDEPMPEDVLETTEGEIPVPAEGQEIPVEEQPEGAEAPATEDEEGAVPVAEGEAVEGEAGEAGEAGAAIEDAVLEAATEGGQAEDVEQQVGEVEPAEQPAVDGEVPLEEETAPAKASSAEAPLEAPSEAVPVEEAPAEGEVLAEAPADA